MSVLNNARVVLGVSGGIAAYKAADLASKLVQAGAIVDVLVTEGASRFIQPMTFQAITKRPVYSGVFEGWSDTWFGHISLAHEADVLVVAPATANTIAHLAHGFAEDMLGAVALSTQAPLVVAPAMEHAMFHHPATTANIVTLRSRGATIVGPEAGRLASGEFGDGRLVSIDALVGAIRLVLGRNGALAGRHVVVSAGGTHEPLDPVRYLGNRSSGLMGYAIAQSALDAGARVTLVTGPTSLTAPYGAAVRTIETADEMYGEVRASCDDADVLIMAAAVADFRPASATLSKIKKGTADEPAAIQLARNVDILASIDRPGLVKVGFAAETDDLLANARDKMIRKGMALMIANDAVKTIGSRQSSAILVTPDGEETRLPAMEKTELADVIVRAIIGVMDRGRR